MRYVKVSTKLRLKTLKLFFAKAHLFVEFAAKAGSAIAKTLIHFKYLNQKQLFKNKKNIFKPAFDLENHQQPLQICHIMR